MRNFFYILAFLTLSSTMAFAADNKTVTKVKTQEQQTALTPWQALVKLKDGNQRFVDGQMRQRDFASQSKLSAQGQFPFAVILGCMDSRGSPELIFDQGIGDIFSMRLAGNVSNDDVLGGMEFGTKLMGAKLIVVLGHSLCGAVRGACDGAELGHVTTVLKKIKPAVDKVKKESQSKTCGSSIVDEMAKENVRLTIESIKKNSPILSSLVTSGQVGLVGGMHDVATGKVTFFEDKKWLPGAPR